MWKNNIKIAWRNLFRHRMSSLVYLLGLAMALLCVQFIGVYIQDEISYDSTVADSELIYRVNLDGKMGPEEFLAGNTPPPVGEALQDNFPEVETYTRQYLLAPEYVSYEDGREPKIFKETRIFSVDSNYLEFFAFPLLEGNAKNGLNKSHSIILTQETAERYFGKEEAVGKSLLLDEWTQPFEVTAVLENLPSNSSLQFDMLIPNTANPAVQRFEWSWVWLQMNTFVKLNPAAANLASVQAIEEKLPEMVKVQAAGAFARVGKPMEDFLANGGRWNLQLQNYQDIHLGSADIFSRDMSHGNPTMVRAFVLVAMLILLMACINSMNLTTARSMGRGKEVGVKKVLGSGKHTLISQFMVEAFLSGFLALILSLILFFVLLPFFNELTGKTFQAQDFMHWRFAAAMLVLVLVTGFFSGIYPAFYLSAFRPMGLIQKGTSPASVFSEKFIRNGLVILQFAISTTLIISSLVIYRQLRYTQEIDMGFDRQQVIFIPQVEKLTGSATVFVEELKKVSQVSQVSLSSGIPTQNPFGDFYEPGPGKDGATVVKDIALSSFLVDDAYLETLGMELLIGRGFQEAFNDSSSVILNETAVNQIGWTVETALGRELNYPGNGNQKFEVIGVVKDFNNGSLHSGIGPFGLFHHSSKSYRPMELMASLRVEEGGYQEAIAQSEALWAKLGDGIPFQINFLDQEVDSLYRSDQKAGLTFGVFTVLAVIIGCIGLFGLIMATTAQRVKEIGVRKVLGASSVQLVGILSRDFLQLVLIAVVIACPLATWAIGYWLDDFAYKVDISPGVYLFAGMISLGIAWLTISFQSVKAANMNPVKSLRSE